MNTKAYDRERFTEAHRKVFAEPTALTDDDLQQLTFGSQDFADRARAKRAGYTEAPMQLDKRTVTVGFIRGMLEDHLGPIFGPTNTASTLCRSASKNLNRARAKA